MLHYRYTHAVNLIFTCLQHEDMSVTIFERIYRGIDDEYLKLDEEHKDKDLKDNDPKEYVKKFVTKLIKGTKVCN